jgi:o-succinylbenzoate---CoA ligase
LFGAANVLQTSKLLAKWAWLRPEDSALITPTYTLNWSELIRQVETLSDSLIRQGVSRGEVITLVGKNQPEMVLLFLAALNMGAITAFVMPQPMVALQDKLTTLYRTQQSKWVWFGRGTQVDLEALCLDSPNLRPLDDIDAELNINKARRLNEATLCNVSPDDNELATNALASIIFTSGSSGSPKAVIHTTDQHLASAQGLLSEFRFNESDAWLLSLPIYHVSGLAIIFRWLVAGSRLKIGSGVLADDIQQVTHASLVPTQLLRLLNSDRPLQLTHVLLGGADIPHHLAQRCAEQGIETWLGYGMTEAASTVTAKQVDGHQGVGMVLPLRDVKLVGKRIYIGGRTLANGYYRQGQISSFCDGEGWFDSKDLGVWHGEQLVILGREDNQFISGGESIHCEEIEARLLSHPDIVFVHVIPVADIEFGARPIAVISSRDQTPNREQLERWLADHLSKFKWPILYVEIPTTLLDQQGIKVSRAIVKEWFSEAYSDFTVMS